MQFTPSVFVNRAVAGQGEPMPIASVADILRCPECKGQLQGEAELGCVSCGRRWHSRMASTISRNRCKNVPAFDITEVDEEHTRSVCGGSGRVKRDLRLFEVKPGLRIAILNILGDTELVQAAAKALASSRPWITICW